MLSILLLTVEARNTICNYIYHKLAQNRMIRTTQNLEHFDKKPFNNHVNHI